MIRWLTITVKYVGIGLLATVVVSLLCFVAPTKAYPVEGSLRWHMPVSNLFPPVPDFTAHRRSFGRDHMEAHATEHTWINGRLSGRGFHQFVEKVGWPLRAFSGARNEWETAAGSGVVVVEMVNALDIRPRNESGNGLLPLQVLWLPLVLNIAIFTIVFLCLRLLVIGTTRRVRIYRGLCPACAYPVGDSEVCTECGKPVVKHKAQTQKAKMT